MKYVAERNGKKLILDGDTPPKLLVSFRQSGYELRRIEGADEESEIEEAKEIRKKEREA